jgi:hypothetical protein
MLANESENLLSFGTALAKNDRQSRIKVDQTKVETYFRLESISKK